jgi:hypothetical protein
MRFLLTEMMVPVGDRGKIKQAIQRQITLREKTTTIDMEFNVTIKEEVKEGPHKGKTLGQLILALTSADEKYGGVPFFKHFVHKWAHSYAFTGTSVAVFQHMAPIASDIMGSLYGIMEKTYGKEVAKYVHLNLRGGASLMDEGDLDAAAFNIKLDDDDWFEGGSANFVMTGIFGQPNKNKEAEQQKEREEERNLIIANDKTEHLMDTLSVMSTYTSETDASEMLSGKYGGGDHGYRNVPENMEANNTQVDKGITETTNEQNDTYNKSNDEQNRQQEEKTNDEINKKKNTEGNSSTSTV